MLQLLEDRCIVLHARQGYIYPRTDLAATVTEGLWQWIAEVGTELHLQEAVTGVQKVPSGFLIRTGTGEEYRADALILATGGMARPQFGCDGSGYQIARSLGHQCTAVRPSLTALKTKDPVLHFAAGVRCLSIFQLSSDAGRALAQGESVRLILDLLPEFDRDSGTFSPGRKAAELIGGTWEQEWNRRMQDTRNISIAEWMNGLAVPRLAAMIAARAGLTAENKIRKLTREQLAMLLSLVIPSVAGKMIADTSLFIISYVIQQRWVFSGRKNRSRAGECSLREMPAMAAVVKKKEEKKAGKNYV